jgi:putative transposase
MLQLLFLLIRGVLAGIRSGRDVALENLVLRHQLQVALRSNPTPPLRNPDRILWTWLRRIWPLWRDHLLVVKPETVIHWHRKGWRLYWSWKSRTRLGRPRLSRDVRELIGAMARDNRLWGTERIRGELLKLGIVVSRRSIRRYRWRKPTPAGSQTWRTFLSNQLTGIWATDLLVVHTINYRVLYVLFFIRHDRRELIHFNVTSSPTAAWVWQQLIEATPWGRQPRYLIHDRDAVYGRKFGARLANLGVASVLTPVRAPRANAIAERLVRTLRSEALDHIIVLNEHHLRAALAEFAIYYNTDRPHRSLHLESPLPRSPTAFGTVVRRPVLGGLHHAYARVA